MSFQGEFAAVRTKLAELLSKDDPFLAERARHATNMRELWDIMSALRSRYMHDYPCCSAAYLYLLETMPHLVELALREAGL